MCLLCAVWVIRLLTADSSQLLMDVLIRASDVWMPSTCIRYVAAPLLDTNLLGTFAPRGVSDETLVQPDLEPF